MSERSGLGGKIEFDWEKFDAILQFKPTRQMCADIMGCSIDTIKRRCKEKHDTTFEDYLSKGFAPMRLKLQQKAILMGLGGNATMLIFSLKNVSNWSDSPDVPDEPITEMNF